MNVQLRKVAGDIRSHWLAIGVIGVVIALGAAGIVAALDARAILEREIAASYARADSPDLVLWLDEVTPALIAEVAAQEGVGAADARRVSYSRIASADGGWLPLRITTPRDLAMQRVAKIHHHEAGRSGGLFIEQSGRTLLSARAGEDLRVRTPGGAIATLPLAGYVHDTALPPSTQDRMIYAYADPETAALLGQARGLDQLLVKMGARGDTAQAIELGERLRERLRKSGHAPLRVDVLPNIHPHAMLMQAVLRTLGVLCAMAFACSAALAASLVSAWMKREVRQVGVMKAIGARWHHIAFQYIALVGLVVSIAVALALPLGAMAGRALARYYEISLNIDLARWTVSPRLRVVELLVAVLLPLVAMAVPIIRASRMTALAALSDAGIASGSIARGRSLRVPGRVALTFALRNTWRRPWRLALTLAALSFGGGLLLTTHSNYESLMAVIDSALAQQGHDIEAVMQVGAPGASLESVARAVPGVERAEAWRRARVSLRAPRSDAVHETPEQTAMNESRRAVLTGYPPDTRLFRLAVAEGRAPRADAADEVLITRTLQDMYKGLEVGSTVRMQYAGREAPVQVVGIVEEIGGPTAYASFATFEAVTGLGDSATAIRVKAGAERTDVVLAALDQALLDARLAPSQIFSRAAFRESLEEHFRVVGDLLRMVALAAAIVGAILLAAATALNVIERTREAGIVRTLGATPRRIFGLFVAEAAFVAIMGAALGIAVSIVLTLGLNEAAARTLLRVAVPLHFSWRGFAVLCAGLLVVLAAVLVPLAFSLRRPAREALTYE